MRPSCAGGERRREKKWEQDQSPAAGGLVRSAGRLVCCSWGTVVSFPGKFEDRPAEFFYSVRRDLSEWFAASAVKKG